MLWLVGRSISHKMSTNGGRHLILPAIHSSDLTCITTNRSRLGSGIAACPPPYCCGSLFTFPPRQFQSRCMSSLDRIHPGTHQQSAAAHAKNTFSLHGHDKIRLGREMERELGLYSFNNSSADSNGSPRRNVPNDHTRDYSLDYAGGDTETGDSNDFFPRSPAPSTHDLSKHFRDFSMHGIESSMDSVEMPRGAKEMGTPEVHTHSPTVIDCLVGL